MNTLEKCKKCNGSGYYSVQVGHGKWIYIQCNECEGKGYIVLFKKSERS